MVFRVRVKKIRLEKKINHGGNRRVKEGSGARQGEQHDHGDITGPKGCAKRRRSRKQGEKQEQKNFKYI